MTKRAEPERLYTRRQWMTMELILQDVGAWFAQEAVASIAIEHPEWNMNEKRTWSEWKKQK